MSTVGNLIERLYRTYLEPPDDEGAYCILNQTVTPSDTTMLLGLFAVSEDVELLRVGSRIELDQELVRVDSVTETPTQITVTVSRGSKGTTAATHNAGTEVKLAPRFPRASTFETVADNIISLSNQLYTVDTKLIPLTRGSVGPMEDNLASQVLEVWQDNIPTDHTFHARIIDYHPEVGGRAVMIQGNSMGGSFWVKYRRRMGVATSETDTLEALGVDKRWAVVVMVGSAADLLVGRDISQSHTDWIGKSMEAETVPVGTRTNVATTLAAYRDVLLKRFADEMRPEYRTRARMRNPFSQFTGVG